MSTRIKSKNLTTDNTKKFLGLEYQKLIALEECLKANLNEIIWIECKGDIATDTASIEVKHHENGGGISSNAVDAWKTLANFSKNYDAQKRFHQLILYTTATSSIDSIFYQWNTLRAEDKLKKLKDHTPSTTISFHKEIFFGGEETDLLDILARFKIIEGQKTIGEKSKEITADRFLALIPDKYKETAMEVLYGMITNAAIQNSNMWHIVINDFRRDAQFKLLRFTTKDVPFPHVSIDEAREQITEKTSYRFVECLREIGLRIPTITQAQNTYFRAQASLDSMIRLTPEIIDAAVAFDQDITAEISQRKDEGSYKITLEMCGTQEANATSRAVYFGSINAPIQRMRNTDETPSYYRDGRIHAVVEESDFTWSYKEADFEG